MSHYNASGRRPDDGKGTRNRGARDRDTRIAAECRAIILSKEGVARLTREILEGDSKSFWRAIEIGFGKPSKKVDSDPKAEPEASVSLDGLSDGAIRFLAAVALDQEQADLHRSCEAEEKVP